MEKSNKCCIDIKKVTIISGKRKNAKETNIVRWVFILL